MAAKIDPEILARNTGDAPSRGNVYRPWDIDYLHAVSKVMCVPETAAYLYDGYTPSKIRYARGSRPELERHVRIATMNRASQADMARALMRHVHHAVLHTMFVPPNLHELGGTEEHILRRGFGYCNEMGRVLVALAQIAGLPARLLFVRRSERDRHALTEIRVDGRWGFFDPTFDLCLPVGGRFASAWEVQRSRRLRAWLDRLAAANEKHTLMKRTPDERYSEFFGTLGLLNYPLTDFAYGVVRPGTRSPRKRPGPR